MNLYVMALSLNLASVTLTAGFSRSISRAVGVFSGQQNLHIRRKAFALMSTSVNETNDSSKGLDAVNAPISNSSIKQNHTDIKGEDLNESPPPMYLAEGIFSVMKPTEWTSNDVVSYIRGILERDAKSRGIKISRPNKRRRRGKNNSMKVGHGGTLDPLATGVLVIGVGVGTKNLQSYLSGSKKYLAEARFGEETDTLDTEGKVVKTASFDHITRELIESKLPKFRGEIMQIPPVFSALRKDGKRLHEEARKGKTAEDLGIEARPVVVHQLDLLEEIKDAKDGEGPTYSFSVECGGGTYIRSLLRDIAYEANSCAVMTSLCRTKQGQFELEGVLKKDDWNAENIYAAIRNENEKITL